MIWYAREYGALDSAIDAAEPEEVDEATEQAALAAQTAALATELRRVRDQRRAAGQDTEWIDAVLGYLTSLQATLDDLSVSRAMRAVVERHGGGPYPVEDLAALAGVAVDDAQRVLEQLVRAGLATPPREPDEPAF